MGRAAFLSLSFLLLSASALLLSLNGCGASKTHSTIVPGKLQHIVLIFQENRTPDNLFHDPVLMAKGADIANNGINSAGQTIPLMPTSLGVDYDLDHSHKTFLAMYDGGKMDGADKVRISCAKGAPNCPPPNAQFQYVQASDAGPYSSWPNNIRSAIACFKPTRDPASLRISSLSPGHRHRRRPAICLSPRMRSII